MPPLSPTDLSQRSAIPVAVAGFRAAWRSVLAYVVIGTYVGIGALTHDFGFGLGWSVASTALVWAGPGAGDPGVGARRRRRADRDCAGGGREQRASSSHGDLAAAVDQAAANPASRVNSAGPSHRGDHVDRGVAAAAARAAGSPHPIRERSGLGLHERGAGGNVGRLLPRHLAAAALDRGAALPHAHILPDLDHAQLPPRVGLAGARARARARA